RGQPTKYKPEYVTQVEKLCLLGATDKDIADFFEVAESTINNWKIEYPEFLESIKKGKLLADANVANSLYKRALGYEAPDIDIRV
ncbi:helix-turn-helix domain-containing protein, partial [Mannheimia haemolytica]